MAFYDKLQLIETTLINKCKQYIINNHHMFDMWLEVEADMEIGHLYQNICKEHFEDYITEEIKTQLWFAGKNILYAIQTFISIKNNEYDLNELLEFVETFILKQIADFENDYDTTFWYNDDDDENPT